MLFVTQLSGGDAVLRSQDGGATFAPFANGLENVVAPRELAFAGNSRLLLASAKGSYGTDLATADTDPYTNGNAQFHSYADSNTYFHSHADGHGDPNAKTYSNPKTSSDAAASPDTTRLRAWLDKYQSPEIAETSYQG